MTLPIHRREFQDVRAQEKAAGPKAQQDFSTLLKSVSQKPLDKKARIEQAVQAAAQEQGLDPNLVYAVIQQESGFKECITSHCGAQGLMQLMPETAKQMGVGNSYDIEQNVQGGTKYLRQMVDQFGGDVRKALAAYNAGPGAVQKYGGVPPYDETRNYVTSVLAHYQSFNGGAPIPDIIDVSGSELAAKTLDLDLKISTMAMVTEAISSRPMNLPMPERRPHSDEPPPPPPTAIRV